jgi:hypothetical protein
MLRLNAPLAGAAMLWLAPGGHAQAQQAMSDVMHATRQPYNIESFGTFRTLILAGDFSPKVDLATVLAKHPTTGVGALAGARGEITIHDGKLIVSYGTPAAHPPAETERAALLAVGTVAAWQRIAVEHDVPPDAIETFLAHMAGTHGLDTEGPFPFQIKGTLLSYVMHLNAAPTNGPHGMGLPVAINRERKGDAIEGMVAGIYVSPDLVGIVVHGGTRTHSHWVAPDGQSTAHLDRWGLKAGATLLLPRR